MNIASLRACARVAWRQARRAPGRATLVIAMVALPVAALAGGATLIRTSVPTLEEHVTGAMGSAEFELRPPFAVDPSALQAELPRGSHVVSIRQWNHSLIVDGSLVFVTAFEPSIPIDTPPIPGLYELLDGRAPKSPGEAAVDPRVLDIFDVRIGDALVIGDRSFRVVGVAARPQYTFDAVLAVAPGTFGPPAQIASRASAGGGEVFVNSYLVDLPSGAEVGAAQSTIRALLLRTAETLEDPSFAEQLRDGGFHYDQEMILTRQSQAALLIDDKARLTGVSFAGTALALFATGLISAAAFAVGIRRQLRVLGLVGATGGDGNQVRAVVLMGGTTLGLAGGVVGIAAGVGAAFGMVPHLHRFTHKLPGAIDVHVPTLLGAGVLGILAATVAAAWPARVATRINTVDALAARMPAPRPPGRLARRGLLLVVVGTLLTGVLFKPGDNEVVLTAGLMLMLIGFLISVPWLVTLAGRWAPALPTATRLAVRETARNGRRTGTAIAAAALALTTPITVTALSLSEEANARQTQMMGEDHLVIGSLLSDRFGRPEPAPEALLREIPRLLPGAIVSSPRGALLDLKRHPPVLGEKTPREGTELAEYVAYAEGPEITIREPGGTASTYRPSAQIMIGDADFLRVLHAEDGIPALEAGRVVGIGPRSTDHGVVRLILVSVEGEPPRIELPAVEAGSKKYSEFLAGYVVSPDGAEALGLLPGPPPNYSAIVAAPRALTREQIRAVKDLVAQYPGIYAQTLADFLPHFDAARFWATAAAVAVALGIVAVVVALIAAESRRDQAILVAVGAGAGARRRIAAARAGLVAFLAALIAVPAGFAPVAVVQWSRTEHFPILVPWAAIGIVLLAVPALSASFGWLTSRAPKSSAMLQPIS